MEQAIPWLTLKSVPGIGNLLFRRLILQFGSPEQVFSASEEQLVRINGLSSRLAKAIKTQETPAWIIDEAKHITKKGYRIITQNDAEYPDLLLQIPDPPPILTVFGNLTHAGPTIAVVGSRNATSYGRRVTLDLCQKLAECGIMVVSGMARGIDSAAHIGALRGGGPTVAVLGAGFNNIYPPESLKLFRKIAENGCVITEFNMDAKPEPHHFPLRNRIISGMSIGTVVVEAARRSGSLITARLAVEQNREVFAVPGSVHAQTARGTHELIKQGAKLVENVSDILEEVLPQWVRTKDTTKNTDDTNDTARVPKALPELSNEEKGILNLIGPYPIHIDELARTQGLTMGRFISILSQLELKGIICQEPGKYFVRNKDYMNRF